MLTSEADSATADLLPGWPTVHKRQVAHHEACHAAVLFYRLGWPIERVSIQRVGSHVGECHYHCPPSAPPLDLLTVALAGPRGDRLFEQRTGYPASDGTAAVDHRHAAQILRAAGLFRTDRPLYKHMLVIRADGLAMLTLLEQEQAIEALTDRLLAEETRSAHTTERILRRYGRDRC